ncbi:DUF3618 domain-containing protein [Streptomyces coeruleorubidus]|uniref:DUF3618 domain-containing protein n=1 Tax=Streptomyces coeruleorubidus TaxID=116188 RepID=A0ABZ0KPW6_STRC4|nr:DUF3618 domain-containing protein [Streptomyces coeruleorubidus]WOT39988.1 DUF3618 domain-containing protein [Streptomyces coeruleorubidus]
MTQPPHDEPTASSPEQLQEQVERTRQELGETVEELAVKTDVKARTQEKATAVKKQVGVLTEQAGAKAAELTGQVKVKAAEATHLVQDKLPDPVKDKATAAAEQVKAKAGQAGQVWQDKAPEPVRAKAQQGARAARANRTVLIAVGSVAVAAWLLRRGRR